MKKVAMIVLMMFTMLSVSCANDSMRTENINDYSFPIFKINDEYYEAGGLCNQVFGKYPEMNNGEFAIIVADVVKYEGGEAGYTGNLDIKVLKSCQIISPDDASQKFDIPEITRFNFSYDNRLLMYHSDSDLFYVFAYKGEYWVYKNQEFVGSYDNLAAQFLESLK